MSVEIPPDHIIRIVLPELRAFFIALGAVEAQPSMFLNSWYRDRERNAAVGGSARSQHLFGLALDVTVPDPTRLVRSVRLAGLVAVDEGTHVHIQALLAGTLAESLFV